MIKNAGEFMKLSALKRSKLVVRGEEIHFRELSVAERGKLLEANNKDPANAPAVLVAICVTDPDGNPLFNEAQAAEVNKTSPEVVDALGQAILRLSGMAPESDDPKA